MRTAVCLILSLLPLQAAALSCVQPSVTRTYNEVNNAVETYVVVEGRLTLDNRKVPKTDGSNQRPPKMTRVPATLSGKSMSQAGFKTPFEKAITLNIACFAAWCGGAQNGMEVLAFLKKEKGGYSLAIDPCGGHVFANQRKLRRDVLRCFQGGACAR